MTTVARRHLFLPGEKSETTSPAYQFIVYPICYIFRKIFTFFTYFLSFLFSQPLSISLLTHILYSLFTLDLIDLRVFLEYEIQLNSFA